MTHVIVGPMDDDCPMCQAARKAKKEGREMTSEEFREASAKAQAAGGIVGTGEDLFAAEEPPFPWFVRPVGSA